MLFDDLERSSLEPAKASDTQFGYLNETARPAFGVVRAFLERWFAEFPADGKPDLARRFRDRRWTNHSGAFFELYCHALLRVHGYSVELHPELPSGRCPDFRVSDSTGPRFYLEATTVLPPSEDQGADSRDSRLNDCINSMDCPDYFINKSVGQYGRNQPSCKKLKAYLFNAIKELDKDSDFPISDKRFEYIDDGWEIDFWFLPRTLSAVGGRSYSPLGITGGTVTYTWDNTAGLLKTLKRKAGRYGDLDLPYVIAVNCLNGFFDKEDVAEVLRGDFVSTKAGFWIGPDGPRNRRVSAVLFADHIVPWTIGSAVARLWENPFASQPLCQDAMQLSRVSWDGGRDPIVGIGKTSAELLDTHEVSQALATEHD